jgi:hypothetical protein
VSITFPVQVNGQAADASFINALAGAVEDHDAALEAMGVDVHGQGKYLATPGTKASSASTTEVAITDYALASMTVPAGRVVEFVARMAIDTNAANDVARIRLRQTSVSGALIAEEYLPLPVVGIGHTRTFIFPWRSTGAAASWVLTLSRQAGTGTLNVTPGHAGIFYSRDVVADTQFAVI